MRATGCYAGVEVSAVNGRTGVDVPAVDARAGVPAADAPTGPRVTPRHSRARPGRPVRPSPSPTGALT